METALVERHGLPFEAIAAGKLRRYFSLKNGADLFRIPVGVVQAFVKLGRLRPSVVFSKGGYVSFPVVLAAWLRRIPVIIHESDAIAGLTTKLCARFAQKILVAYPSAADGLKKHAAKVEVVGNPIRSEIMQGDPELGRRLTGFKGDRPVLLVMGGSSGAAQLNQIVKEEKTRLLETFDLIHLTGAGHGEPQSEAHYWSSGFVNDEMNHLYALTTHAVTRAGANSLAELEALQIPSLIYPLGLDASRGDQVVNAAFMAKKHDFMVVADPSKSAHSQLMLLPERKMKIHASTVAEHIARLLLEYE